MSNHSREITVIVVTYRGVKFLGSCLRSLAQQTLSHQVVVVDNASTDGTAALLRTQFPAVRVISQAENTGFAGGVAAGLTEVRTPFFALLNDDATADPRWLEELLKVISESPEIAVVTSQMWLVDPPDQLNNCGVAMTAGGYGYDIGLGRTQDWAFDRNTDVFGFSGGAAMGRADALRKVGGSPVGFFLYYEDVDMSWRLRLAGYSITSVPEACVRHMHSATVGQQSVGFHRYNERNRLVTLLRCAPASVAVRELVLFAITTASLAVKLITRRPVPPAANFSVTLRLGVLQEILRSAPEVLRSRRSIGRFATVDRRQIARQWLGADPYQNQHKPDDAQESARK